MDRCPDKLRQKIFQLACTDGGFTGCSLALVSRSFYHAVHPVQLHSVALCGVDKMWAFVRLMKHRDPAHRRVRHLFLALGNRKPVKSSSWITTPPLNPQTMLLLFGNDSPTNMDDVLLRIFTAVAPDLLTLASTLPSSCVAESEVLFFPFPCLTELTLAGWLLWPDAPSVRYLHILSNAGDTMSRYASNAPALTHLRLSKVDVIYSEWKKKFEVALNTLLNGPVDTDHDPEVVKRHVPSALQKMKIQTRRLPPLSPLEPVPCTWPRMVEESRHLNEDLDALKRLDKEGKLEIFSAPANQTLEAFNRIVRDEWEDRVAGGAGCWGEA